METFAKATESQVTRAILSEFVKMFDDHIETEVIVIGGGPSGLMAARDMALKGVKVLIVERNNYLGGGFWIGGYLMNTVTVRHPAEGILEELGIPFKEHSPGLFTTLGPHACSKLIAAACDAGVAVLNMTSFEDVVVREKSVTGAVINWTPVKSLPREITCVDPVSLESNIIMDSTGHDAVVLQALERRGLFSSVGYGPMWVEKSEDKVLERTGEVYPGVIATGMAVSTAYGLPRMGPTFGSMLLSGRRAAEIALEKLRN